MAIRHHVALVLTPILAVSLVLAAPAQQVSAASGILAPWPPGITYQTTMIPGPNQNPGCPLGDHCTQPDLYAWDFGLFFSNTIAAAHTGTVLRMVMGWAPQPGGNCSSAYKNQANYIVLDHGDGNSTLYWHMQQNSNLVNAGQFVYQGRPLGGADDTGWSCGSHIHFALERTPVSGDPPNTDSRPVTFDDIGSPNYQQNVTSGNHARYSALFQSQSPWVTLSPGQTAVLVGQWINNGWDLWLQGSSTPTRIGTWNPIPGQDQPSNLGGAAGCSVVTDWVACNRINQTTAQVDPGQSGWFQFTVRGPASSGVYKLYVRPVVDGVQWMEDYGVFWQVTVP